MSPKPSVKAPAPDSTPLSSFGLSKITLTRLARLGVSTLGELADLSYEQLLVSPTIGARTILELDALLGDHNRQMKDMPSSYNKASIEKAQRELRQAQGVPMKTRGTPRKRVTRDQPAYVEIITQRGYRCRSCESITTVGIDEAPKGIEFAGFTFIDDLHNEVIEPYFVCADCAGHMEIMGKLTATLMSGDVTGPAQKRR